MKFIELTCYSGPSKRLLLNINNIASIYSGIRYNEKKKEYEHVTVIQETTSADNYWEVTETIDEVIALLRKQIKAQEEEKGYQAIQKHLPITHQARLAAQEEECMMPWFR